MITVDADVRYCFTVQFLRASAHFAQQAVAIEAAHCVDPGEQVRSEHRGLVTASIMQSVAAIETEIADVLLHGPGNHLGSDKTDQQALQFLKPLADVIDREDALSRYRCVLHLLKKPSLKEGHQPWQDAATLVKLRNEVTHYKSKWGQEMTQQRLFQRLQQLQHPRPPFINEGQNFFPHQCLSAACAGWAVTTAVAFIDEFYHNMGIESRLERHRALFVGL